MSKSMLDDENELLRLGTQYSVLRDEMRDISDSDSLLEMGTEKSTDASWRWFAALVTGRHHGVGWETWSPCDTVACVA